MKISNSGDTHAELDQVRNMSFLDVASDTDLPTSIYLLQFYLIRDTKGVFQLLGQSGYDSSYCIFCKCRLKTWKEKYSLRIGAYVEICIKAKN